MYHPHADEVRQQQAGLSGALLVLDDPAAFDPTRDIVLLITAPRRNADDATAVLLNGTLTPAPLELARGERYRFRLVNVHISRPSMIARLLRDGLPVTWLAVAKDGMDLPAERTKTGPAVQQMGNGETYDFVFTPREAGELRFLVTSGAGVPLVSMPVRVRWRRLGLVQVESARGGPIQFLEGLLHGLIHEFAQRPAPLVATPEERFRRPADFLDRLPGHHQRFQHDQVVLVLIDCL
ncbi:MAG TPA: hypothetical protein VGA78_16790 [Gemmatimonadales bacterium]|jgi:FtsP/CotA-like multicopper oxidase with cupredoxin domain